MGVTQFALLGAAGIRESHTLLDLGCGSLRAGRFLISFLEKGHYCGIEPNQWLVEEGIANNLGNDLVAMKAPRFDANDSFDCSVFDQEFDFVVAQSILSHTKVGMARRCINNVARVLMRDSLFLATFVLPRPDSKDIDPPEDEWVYPGLVNISEPMIADLFSSAGLSHWRLPWFHPRQVWFAASFDPTRLSADDVAGLTGYVVGADALRNRK